MSETPRTDEYLRRRKENGHTVVVSSDFARQLEAELAEARAENNVLLWQKINLKEVEETDGGGNRMNENPKKPLTVRQFTDLEMAVFYEKKSSKLETELAEAWAEIGRLKIFLATESMRADGITIANDELESNISERDELIEQMRRALEYALTEARSTECERLVKAALSAAGMGGKWAGNEQV